MHSARTLACEEPALCGTSPAGGHAATAGPATRVDYEAAFATFLSSRGVPYVDANDHRAASFWGAAVKSFDFLVYPPGGPAWLVDVKGRRFPYTAGGGAPRYWENWVTLGDLEGLACWEQAFGPGYEARLVFAYLLEGAESRWPAATRFARAGHRFAFLAVRLDAYRRHCRRRSPRWQTCTVPAEVFRGIARPVEEILDPATTGGRRRAGEGPP